MALVYFIKDSFNRQKNICMKQNTKSTYTSHVFGSFTPRIESDMQWLMIRSSGGAKGQRMLSVVHSSLSCFFNILGGLTDVTVQGPVVKVLNTFSALLR